MLCSWINNTSFIIDDEEDIRFMLRLHLERAGYQVSTASNVVGARTSLREASIDCVLSDLVMPGGSGLELLDLMHDEQSNCPFVLMSAHADIETALAAIERGAFDFVSNHSKPKRFSSESDEPSNRARCPNASKPSRWRLMNKVLSAVSSLVLRR